ncbi:MAG: SH3 domain-containing protein [Acidobacteria bacterium]|jgi:hypothetical protein|nr:SH3 domain-containing protein [Acidobacteriota bacterium]
MESKARIIHLLCLFLFLGTALHGEKELYTVSEKTVNFRSGPGIAQPILGALQRGDRLELLQKSGAWLKVICRSGAMKGKEGYVHQNVVVPVTAAAPASAAAKAEPEPKKKPAPAASRVPATTPLLTRVDASDVKLMEDIQRKMLADSMLFLGLLKQMEPKLVEEKKAGERVPRVKTLRANTPVLDSPMAGAKVIHYPYLNEAFDVLEEGDDHYKIGLPGKREGWVLKTAVQFFREVSSRPVVKFAGVDKLAAARFLAQLADVFNQIAAGKSVADRIVANYDPAGIRRTPLYASYEKVNKYYRIASQFHEKYRIDESLAFAGTRAGFLARLKLWGELLLGVEKTGTQYAGESAKESVGGGKHALSLGGSYQAGDDLEVSLDLGTQKDVMLEAFTQTRLNGGVRFTGVDRMSLSLNAGIDSYGSPDNPQADYSGFNLGADMAYRLSAGADLALRYGLQSYSYANDAPSDYLTHRVFAGLNAALSASWGARCDLLFEAQSGDLANRKFSRIHPVLTLAARKSKGFFKTRLLLDTYSFSDLKEYSYMKLGGDLNWGSGRSDLLLGGYLKSYAENEAADYSRLMLRYASNSRDFKKRFAVSVFTSLFANEKARSYSDLSLEMSSLGRFLTNSFNLLFKFWHSPGDADLGETVSPHVIDLFWKLGFNLKYLAFGPMVGVHGNLVLSGGGEVLKRDGNLLRFGAFADLNLPLSDRLRITGQGTFELGNVYTSDYTGFNDSTGEILIDGVYLRHPTTLQLSGTAQYQVNSSIFAFVRGGFYLVKTGFDPIPGMYPVDSNSRFYLLGGVNFRLN